MEQVVVVGASLAGLRAAEQLRRRKYAGRLVLIGAEPTLPYDRPPLSKEVLRGELEPDAIGLRRRPYEELDLDLRLGARAVGLDPAAGRVELDGAAPVAYDGLVIATGSRVRTLCEAKRDTEAEFLEGSCDDVAARIIQIVNERMAT